MATMLRSAALTLLSKTLLTFLYKYLSDVDVEGVEMPSLYGSAEGPQSGWGVRLSNVKLREGAELMSLPGSKNKPSTAKTKAKTAVAANKPGGAVGDHNNPSSTNIDAKTEKVVSDRNKDEEHLENYISPKRRKTPVAQQQNRHGPPVRRKDDNKSNRKSSGSKSHYSVENSVDATLSSTDIAGGTMESGRRTNDSDTDESLSSLAGSEGPRPETPIQESSMSFLSCFAPGSEDANAKKRAAANKQRVQEANASSDPSQKEREKGGVNNYSPSEDPRAVKINGHFKPVLGAKNLRDSVQHFVEEHEGEYDDENDKGDDDSNTTGEIPCDENETEEDSMVLRIGEGGYIGTLDVRLVGRELHVLVEDAFLTLEVVTKKIAKEGSPVTSQAATDKDGSTPDSAPPDSAEKKATTSAPASAEPVDLKSLKTTGERVLAMNAIARIFSSIPHLFLRDILVRIVVLDEAREEKPDDTQGNTTGEADLGGADLIVDVGVGLLSVTEGEDFLSPFHNEETSSQSEDQQQSNTPILKTQTSQSGSSPENEYLERRIRTGKGADGGIWLNVVTPKCDNTRPLGNNSKNNEAVPSPATTSYRWARHEWLEATRYSVLRCSGLDIQARIFLGTKKELAQASSSYFLSDDLDTYQGIDHTLYGFDHVVPGPTPHTLPPLVHPKSSRSMDELEEDTGNLMSQLYKPDRNGIQSSKMESCFHRVARGMTPTRCTLEHLPCQNCAKCWKVTCKRAAEAVDEQHHLDSFTPMPGLALSISLREPLILNADRLSLDGLGLLIRLFTKPAEDTTVAIMDPEQDACFDTGEDEPPIKEVVAEPQSTGYFSFLFASKKSDDDSSGGFSLLSPRKQKSAPVAPAFPTYMKPENLQICGIFLSEVRIRVHLMLHDDKERQNTGLSFCYWDIRGECLTLDHQRLISDEKTFQDLRLDLAILEVIEKKGVEQKLLVSAGVPYPEEAKELVSLESLSSPSQTVRPPWPTTACALLDVPPTLESLVYESRERHGVQLRLLCVTAQPGTDSEKTRILVNCQVGVVEVNVPWPVGEIVHEVKSEAYKSLFGIEHSNGSTDEPVAAVDNSSDTATQYRIQIGGGHIRLGNLIDVRLPLTRFAGDICPVSGFSIETLLAGVELLYGQSSEKLVPTANSAGGVSIRRLASLPENVRLRILLFVDDLDPLEKALGVKRQSNSFLRCNAVNKGLGKVASKKPRKKAAETASERKLSRRQELMNKLLTLDDDALENLWVNHQKRQRKFKKGHTKKAPH